MTIVCMLPVLTLKKLKISGVLILMQFTRWLQKNYMTLNAGKCYFMCLGKDTVNETFIFKEQQRTKYTWGYYRQQSEL